MDQISNDDRVSPEKFQGNRKPEWLKEDSINIMNTDSRIIKQYKSDKS